MRRFNYLDQRPYGFAMHLDQVRRKRRLVSQCLAMSRRIHDRPKQVLHDIGVSRREIDLNNDWGNPWLLHYFHQHVLPPIGTVGSSAPAHQTYPPRPHETMSLYYVILVSSCLQVLS